uniref:C2H2-type domain-containing protein n=1 Tax=Theropithecus gelada TaxID=9565 RepID=A0A8D2EC85_THEGE
MAEAAAPSDWYMQTDLQGEAQIRSAEVSLLAIVAAIQVVEKKMEPQAAWLQSLEGRTRTAEEKLADCEKVAGKWAMLGTLLQEYGLLQRQLENVLCNRNFWILWLPPGSKGEAPKVPVTPEDTVGYFSEQQGGGLEDSQKELYKRVVKGSCETLSSLGKRLPVAGRPHSLYPSVSLPCRDLSELQRGVWREGPRDTSQPGLLEGGPGKESSRGSTCGGLLPDPREREVAFLPPGPPSQAEPAARGMEQCPPCAQWGQSFGWKELSPQQECAHHAPRPFASAQCPKSFPHWATPTSHHQAHVAQRTYTGARCSKTFVRQSTLTPTTHRHTHISEKPFQCAQCDKRFTHLANLTVHQRMHSGERAFQCAQCGRRFAQKPGFLRHLCGHSQEKRYPCSRCGESFTCPSWLMCHQDSHAGHASPPCLVCERDSPIDEPPTGLRDAVRGSATSDPSAAFRFEGTGTELSLRRCPGDRQRSSGDQEGVAGSPLDSSFSRVKMENVGSTQRAP